VSEWCGRSPELTVLLRRSRQLVLPNRCNQTVQHIPWHSVFLTIIGPRTSDLTQMYYKCLLEFLQSNAFVLRPKFKSRKSCLSHTKTKVRPISDPYDSESWTASRPDSHFGFLKGRDTRFPLRMSVFIVLISYWAFKLEVQFPFWVLPLPPRHFGLQIWKKAGNV